MHAYITGATGFLGRHVVEQLIAHNWHITALCRDLSKVDDYPIKGIHWKLGNVCDIASLRQSVPENVDAIFHLAGDTTTWSFNHNRQYQVNVIGTQNLAKVALEKNTIRFIHTSSIAVYGFHDYLVDENSEMRGIDSPIAYYRTKFLAEEVIREYIRKGLDAVILNPAAVVGPYDKQNWIRMFESIYHDRLPGIPSGSKSFCFAEDVAKAHIQAFVHGRNGENYVLGGHNAQILTVCQWISKRLKKPIPFHTMPDWAFKTVGVTLSALSLLSRKEPAISIEQAQIVCSNAQASSEKAHRELQYRHSKSLDDMLEITYHWWQSRQALLHKSKQSSSSKQDVA